MLPAGAIDVHAHFLPAAYRDALAAAGLRLVDGGMPVPDWSAEAALELMDRLGTAAAVLSVSSPFAADIAGADAAALCRACNDAAADLRQRHPTRFGGFAMLPVPDMPASLAALTRALDVLGLDGVALPTSSAGHYLGDPAFAPLLDALDERGATIFVHPTSPCCFEAIGLRLPAPMIEFPFDTTRTIVSLLYGGALERRRRINFIFSHGGGTLPMLAGRIAGVGSLPLLGDRAVPAPAAIEQIRSWHYDLALASAPAQVAALRELVPVSQILYGTDFPFAPAPIVAAAGAAMAALPLTDADRHAIACGNAARLLPQVAHRCGCAALHA